MTQVETLRRELVAGRSVSQRSALMDFGIMALPRRIADLREKGFPVKVEMKTNPHTGQRYASYSMDDEVHHISELRHDCVYRVVALAHSPTPFAESAVANSQGYFKPLRGGRKGDDEIMIHMAGIPQILLQDNLDSGTLKVKYIGGMN